jgi:hypothetical protein
MAQLFDRLIGDIEADRQPERCRGLEIDDQLNLGRLPDRKIGGRP